MSLFRNRNWRLFFAVVFLSLALTACGGGDSVAPIKTTTTEKEIPDPEMDKETPDPEMEKEKPPPPPIFDNLQNVVTVVAPSRRETEVRIPVGIPDQADEAGKYIPTANAPPVVGKTAATNPCLQNARTACTLYIGYHSITASLVALTKKHSDVAVLFSIGITHEGRLIPAVKISDNPRDDENEAVILIVGGYHAREWLAINFVYLLIEYLLQNKDVAEIKWHLDNGEIWIVPLLNADGRDFDGMTLAYNDDSDCDGGCKRLQRKNRRPIADGIYGVDLNRNHNYLWGTPPQTVTTRWNTVDTVRGNVVASDTPSSNTYRGPRAHSELETRAICRLAHRIYPDVGVSYHAFSQLVLYPWGYRDERGPVPDNTYNLIKATAEKVSKNIAQVHNKDYTPQPGSALYNTNGDFGDWLFGVLGAWSYTPELRPPSSFLPARNLFYPPTTEIVPTFEENVPAALHFIRAAIVNDRAARPILSLNEDCN